jgi:hypothetical protein
MTTQHKVTIACALVMSSTFSYAQENLQPTFKIINQQPDLVAALKEVRYAFTKDLRLGYYFEIANSNIINLHICKSQDSMNVERSELRDTDETCESVPGTPQGPLGMSNIIQWKFDFSISSYIATSFDTGKVEKIVPCDATPGTYINAALAAQKEQVGYFSDSLEAGMAAAKALNLSGEDIPLTIAMKTPTLANCELANNFWTIPLEPGDKSASWGVTTISPNK